MTDKIRLLSWNILEGFHRLQSEDPDRPLDEARLSAARTVIADLKPDILALNEALWCREINGRFVDYAALLGFEHIVCDTYDGEWGNAILSRLPIAKSGRFRIHNRGGVKATIKIGGRQITVATYHPHPSRYPENKAADYRKMVAVEGPLIVCGDFNAINPADAPDRETLLKAFSTFSEKPGPDLDRFLIGGKVVFAVLESLGLHDAIPMDGRHPTIPTRLISKNTDSSMRIDHILVNDQVKVVSGEVVRHPSTDLASDHYPVMVDFAI